MEAEPCATAISYVPIRRRFTFDEVREMAEAIDRFLPLPDLASPA